MKKNIGILFLIILTTFVLNAVMPSTAFAGGLLGGCPTQYTIYASAGPGGTISPSGSVELYEGDSQTFFITANGGYSIQNVTVDGSSQGAISSYTFSNISSDHSISASFSGGSVTLTVYIAGSGDVTANGTVFDGPRPDPFTRTYSSGETANLSGVGDPGWAFASWSGALTGSTTPATLVMNGNKTITATFGQIRVDASSPYFSPPVSVGNGHYKFTMPSDPNDFNKFENVNIEFKYANTLAAAQPRDVGIIESGSTSMKVKWTQPASPAAVNYKVQVYYAVLDPSECFTDGVYSIQRNISPGDPNLTVSGNERTYEISSIDPSVPLRCARVSASNTNGESGFSEPTVAKRPAD